MKTLAVFIFGVVVGTIGVTGVANIAQHGINKVQEVAKDAAR